MSGQPSTPFDHRARRRILRRLHKVPDTSTAAELATDLKVAVTEVLYHARVLVKYKKIRERRRGVDPADTRFESTVADDPEVVALLISTEAEDERE
jgi:DNA-binding transcriptional ArsR family regulator